LAKQYLASKDYVIITEGYFDLLTLHQCGLKHSVATLGTALTTLHIRTLKRYTKNLIIVFDADPAGVQATLRTLPLFLEEEVWGKTVVLPKGQDVDDFLRKGNVEAFEKKVAEAVPLIDFFFEQMMKTYDVKSIEGKVKVVEEGVALIRRIPEGIRRNFYMKVLSEKLGLQESVLYEMLRSYARDRIQTEKDMKKRFVERAFPKAEEMVVRLMVQHPELIPMISEEGILKEFESPILQKMADTLESLYQKKGSLNLTEALGYFDEDLKGRLCEFALQENAFQGGQREKILKDCIQKIREKRLKKDENELLRRIKEAEKQKGEKGLEILLMERQEMARKERGLQKHTIRKG
jgi:DNA primase